MKWPIGIGQKGNEGVAGMVRSSPYSFGYVELIYALQNHMSFGLVRNAAGKYVKASVAGVTEAAAGAAKNMPADYRVSITNAPGADAYPISSFTWLLIPTHWADPAKGKVMVEFLNWMLDHGESEAEGLRLCSAAEGSCGQGSGHHRSDPLTHTKAAGSIRFRRLFCWTFLPSFHSSSLRS